MALKKGNKKVKPGSSNACCNLETKKTKPVKKKYSVKKTESYVMKTTVRKEDSTTESSMFYPPSPYYAVSNEWSTGVQCPMYTLQHLPVIVNPVLSTQIICPYSPIVMSPVTVASEFPLPPLVPMTNEFPLLTNDASPIGTSNELSMYCEPVINLQNDYSNLSVCSEILLDKSVIDNPQFSAQSSNEIITQLTPILNEYSLATFEYEFSPAVTPISDVFSPIQNIQVPQELIPICNTEFSPLSSSTYDSYKNYNCELSVVHETEEIQDYKYSDKHPLDFYLSLPKDLFPTANMMTIDPNVIIDEFCKVSDLDDSSWILDLEFGVPKTPVTRRVATYDVKLNSIQCKNTPEAIHPGFERCDKDLKRVLMIYYDCVISNWYRGYMALSSDGSVENFQSWLLIPMQVLGMCWA